MPIDGGTLRPPRQRRICARSAPEHAPRSHFVPFDASEHLDDEDVIAEYLAAAAETGDPTFFVTALGDVAKARGMAQIAKDAGLGRESLYKALNGDTRPRFETISAVMRALGVKFSVIAEHRRPG